jgi:hypothetical protein
MVHNKIKDEKKNNIYKAFMDYKSLTQTVMEEMKEMPGLIRIFKTNSTAA